MSQLDHLTRQDRKGIEEARRLTRAIPSRWGMRADYLVLIVGRGNKIATIGATDIYGMKRITSSPITELPAVDPPTSYADGAYTDGLTPAETIDGTLVWLSSRIRLAGASTDITDMIGSLPKGTPVICRAAYLLPITGTTTGATGIVYLPYSI